MNEMLLTTISITAVRVSNFNAQETFSAPDWIQVSSGTVTGSPPPTAMSRKIVPRQHEGDGHQAGGDPLRRLVAELLAEQADEQESQQREKDGCDVHDGSPTPSTG